MVGNNAYRAAVGVALAAAFVLVWMNLAVGVIGSEDNPANLMHGGVLAAAIVGVVIARFRPRGMARALLATALAKALVAVIALIAGLGFPASGPLEILALMASSPRCGPYRPGCFGKPRGSELPPARRRRLTPRGAA